MFYCNIFLLHIYWKGQFKLTTWSKIKNTQFSHLSPCIILCKNKSCGFSSIAAENMCVAQRNHILQLCPNKTGQSHMVRSYVETDRKWGREEGSWGGRGLLVEVYSHVCYSLESCQIESEVQSHDKYAEGCFFRRLRLHIISQQTSLYTDIVF